jgi:hypothetical protein
MRRVVFLMMIFAVSAVNAQKLKNTEFSVSAAYMFEDAVLYFHEINQERYVGDNFFFKGDFSYFPDSFSRRFGFGVYYTFGQPFYAFYDVVTQHEFGLSLKARFSASLKILIVPTVYVGYRIYDSDDGDPGEGLGLNFSAIFQYRMEKVSPFLDVGFMTQPAGGNDATDITYSPVFIIGGGVSF